MNLPEPSLMTQPAATTVRKRWVGKKIKIHKKHLNYTPKSEKELNQRNRWIEMGTGTILDVGKAMWFRVAASILHDIRMKIYLALVTLVLALSGCATTNSYHEPKKETAESGVKGYHESNGLFHWMRIRIDMVDNQPVSYILRSESREVLMDAGDHTLTLLVYINQGGTFRDAFIDLPIKTEKGKTYAIRGRVEGTNVLVWAEDEATKEKATQVIKAPYSHSPTSTTVPVFL
jgi:hypothetical protein